MRKNTFDFIVKRFVLILMLIFPCALLSETFTDKCVGVSDGDTITVMREGKGVKVRLDGVDCPEKNQDFGSRAKQFTSSMVFGKEIQVDVRTTDRYGRLVGRVNVDGKDLSSEIIKAGMGWHYKQYNEEPGLASAEESARSTKIGLWSIPNPIPPWEFRHGGSIANQIQPGKSNEITANEVYITQTGKKYHRAGCGSLSRSMLPISLKDAVNRGYGPCKRCNPPTLESSQATQTPNNTSINNSSGSSDGQCQAITKKGTRCKRKAKPGSNYCWQHG